MKNNEENIEPLSRKTILLINISLVLISILFIGSVVSVIRYKKQKAEQQKVLLLQQQEVLESLKTSFPDYRNSQDYKEKTEMAIPKISIDEVQEGGATLTLTNLPKRPSLGDCKSDYLNWGQPEPTTTEIREPDFSPLWRIVPEGSPYSPVGSSDDKNGWDVSGQAVELAGTYSLVFDAAIGHCVYAEPYGGYYYDVPENTATISIPSGATVGTYILKVSYEDETPTTPNEYVSTTFKITPPCPAGVELTITPQG